MITAQLGRNTLGCALGHSEVVKIRGNKLKLRMKIELSLRLSY